MNTLSKNLTLAVLLLAATGCWEEIRYEPQDQPITPRVSPVAQEEASHTESDEHNISDDSDTTDPETPTSAAEELFAAHDETLADPIEAPADEAVADDDLGWLDDSPEPTPAVSLASAWQLGSKWSLAVCICGKGRDETSYGGDYDRAKTAANELQVELPSLSDDSREVSSEREKLTWAIDTLLNDSGPTLTESLGEKHSARHQALCELAIGTHALLLYYLPNREGVEPTATTIRRLAREAQLSEQLWLPVAEAMENQAEFKVLKAAVLNLHRNAATYLEGLKAE